MSESSPKFVVRDDNLPWKEAEPRWRHTQQEAVDLAFELASTTDRPWAVQEYLGKRWQRGQELVNLATLAVYRSDGHGLAWAHHIQVARRASEPPASPKCSPG